MATSIKLSKRKKILSITQGEVKPEEDLIEALKCSHCGTIQKMPEHCDKPMHKEGDQLVCWMGASCGAQPIPEHCGKEMEITCLLDGCIM